VRDNDPGVENMLWEWSLSTTSQDAALRPLYNTEVVKLTCLGVIMIMTLYDKPWRDSVGRRRYQDSTSSTRVDSCM